MKSNSHPFVLKFVKILLCYT